MKVNSGYGGEGQHQSEYQPTAAMLEEENTRLEEALSGKVKTLKSVSYCHYTFIKFITVIYNVIYLSMLKL